MNDELGSWARSKRISRRQFMERAIATGLTISAANAVWTGKVMAATPSKGGSFRLAMQGGATTDSLDPRLVISEGEYVLYQNIHAYLVAIGPDDRLAPEIAKSWAPDPDASRWVFELNPDAAFHDGRKVTADDVIASINVHVEEGSTSAIKAILEEIESMEKDGDHTVIFTLSGANSDFPHALVATQCAILPKSDDGVEWRSGIGAGPYKLESFEPGVQASLVRNENMWLPDRGFVDSVEIVFVNDTNARIQSLITGDMDMVNKVEPRLVARIDGHPDISVLAKPTKSHFDFPMHFDTAPYDSNDVRLALKYAFDRQEFVDKILSGFGELGNDQPISPSHQFYNPNIPQREYDPEKAKFHLKKAGYDTLDLSLSTSDGAFAGAVDAAILFKERARKAGLNITVQREPADGYWSDVWSVKPFIASYWNGRSTEDAMFSIAYAGGAPWNVTRFADDRFDELLVAARAETDTALRAEMYGEMQVILHERGSSINPAFTMNLDGRRKNVGVPEQVASNSELDGYRALQRWWKIS